MYCGSMFLGYDSQAHILNHFVGIIKDLKFEYLYQIWMDGPNCNKIFPEFLVKFTNENLHSLVDIGSCSLLIVQWAIQTGAEKSKQALKKLLTVGCMILHNFPTRKQLNLI